MCFATDIYIIATSSSTIGIIAMKALFLRGLTFIDCIPHLWKVWLHGPMFRYTVLLARFYTLL